MTAATRQDVLSHPYTMRIALSMKQQASCRNLGPVFLIDGLFLMQKGGGKASLASYISKDKSDMDTIESLGESIITGQLMPRHKWSVLLLVTECETSKSTVLLSVV